MTPTSNAAEPQTGAASRSALDAAARHRIEERLMDERRRRSEDLETALESSPSTPGGAAGELSDVPSHPADAAHHTDEVDRDQRTAERSTEAIRRIDDALRRLRDDPHGFGRCRVCDEPIAEERLALVPWTEVCAEHARTGPTRN